MLVAARADLARSFVAALGLLAVFAIDNVALAAHTFEELPTDRRAFRVQSRVTIGGQLQTATGEGKALGLKLEAQADLGYLERRLPGAGRDAEALRALRAYERAEAKITVNDQVTSARLRPDRNMLVAMGRREGVAFYSPAGSMTYDELELLRAPCDSLAVVGLLPHKPVEIGESWDPPSWVIQTLTSTEAVLKSNLKCTLASIEGGAARVDFSGNVEGAVAGATAQIDLSGFYVYDVNSKYIRHLEAKQSDKRTVGSVSPGSDIVASVVFDRAPMTDPGPLTDAAVSAIPLNPDESVLLLKFQSPWNIEFLYDRNWHVFHQSDRVAVLRLLDRGALVAQCNVSKVPSAKPGEHTPEQQFQSDIRTSLGETFKDVVNAEEVKSEAGDGRFLYRVTVAGEANGLKMTWIYYLCAAPNGEQVAFVFAVESSLAERLANRDLGLVNSLRFLPAKSPTRAAGK